MSPAGQQMARGQRALSDPADGGAEDVHLDAVPLFASIAETPSLQRSAPSPAFGVYAADQIVDRRALASQEVDWHQVVALRKVASSAITDQTQTYIAQSGRPMSAQDRLLMGRAIISRVVADHVRALHRDGAALWSTDTEFGYVRTEAP
jgi:hypothetical protein